MNARRLDGSGYHLEFDYEAPRLRVRVVGGKDTSLAVTGEYWLHIADEVQASGAAELLVLDAMQGEVMVQEDLERFFAMIAGRGLEQVRMAYVEGRADQVPRIEFAELMARERGFNVRVFHNETDAVVWLSHGVS